MFSNVCLNKFKRNADISRLRFDDKVFLFIEF